MRAVFLDFIDNPHCYRLSQTHKHNITYTAQDILKFIYSHSCQEFWIEIR